MHPQPHSSSCIIPAVATEPTPNTHNTHSFLQTVLIANPGWEFGSVWQINLNTIMKFGARLTQYQQLSVNTSPFQLYSDMHLYTQDEPGPSPFSGEMYKDI